MGHLCRHGPRPDAEPGPWCDLITTYAERYDRPCMLSDTNLRGFLGDRATWLKVHARAM